ncbi:alpha/beta hydrolase [Iamia sp.]|uniref:alpha/beta fold hydrolase n=1 Tax=Iamia sp. TaxID=2722710 RepID=UPI002BF969F6|nr:alpha/beta hydrolase [Iamia sp.]HXH59679.1 alpha/beta hydrolase [Iamia sp.]
MAEVVFLHAGVADERSWPGPGLAYRRTGAVDPVEELFATLDAHDIERPTLVGNSIGARTAIDAALERPERIDGLFLIAPSVSGAPVPESLPTEVRLLEAAIGEAEAVADLDEVNRLEAHLWLDGPMSSEGRVGGDGRALFLDMNGAALRAPEPMPERDREPAWPRVHELDIRAHVLVGALDLPHVIDRAVAFADRVPRGTVELMCGVAHVPTLERPADVLASLEQFLAADAIDEHRAEAPQPLSGSLPAPPGGPSAWVLAGEASAGPAGGAFPPPPNGGRPGRLGLGPEPAGR